MTQKLQDAVAVFKALGWENATPENVLQLPLGTTEQKRTALAGLKSGEWGEIAEIKKNTYGWRSHVEADESKLALFAVRIGVDAKRAVNILRAGNNEMLVKIIAERGAKYASDFIGYACVSSRRAWEHSSSAFGSAAVYLVDKLDLDIPQNVEYMKDWSVYAAAAMGLKAETRHGETDLPGLEVIEKRFVEHVLTGVAVNAPATGPFGAVLPAGVKRGWLPRGKAVELVFSALDASVRPVDRKIWLGVLDELGISDEELRAHLQALIPLLASGESAVITRLAPVLIAQADEGLLSEVLLAAFSATAKKTRQLVLKSALGRTRPENAEDLASWLSILAGDTDKSVASLSARLIKQWGISVDALPEEKNEIRGLWQKTPPVWQVPPFDLGEVSPEGLTELAAKLARRPAAVHDVITERFWAMANAVAYQNPEAARISLRGLRPNDPFLYYVACWVNGVKPQYG
ncbi:MAG: PRTRC system protein E, partial [Defluviitaleaceae bacterium]|nr:PRTRC system protein E [Defluviitaleaceae bacterium]